MPSNVLYLFTNNYPYAIGEEFLKDELEVLSNRFELINIIPSETGGSKRQAPENCRAIDYKYPNKIKKITIIIKNIFLILEILISEFFATKNKKLPISYLKKNALIVLNQFFRLYALKYIWHKNAVYYSYWTNDWATLLAIAQKKRLINEYVSRIHGYDLIEERYPYNYIPFRQLQFHQAIRIVAISKKGRNYLSKKYPLYNEKFEYSYLGVKTVTQSDQLIERDGIHIVSCSRLDNNKRVELIAEAFCNMELRIHWTHIGDGKNRPVIERLSKKFKSNISFDFKGHIDNAEIKTFYATNQIDAFINVSISEGLPVTMMEAISFGIPIIATDVGGVSEIVNKNTGILLPCNLKITHIINSINTLIEKRKKSLLQKEKIITFQQTYFDAKKNYNRFCKKYLLHHKSKPYS